MTSSPDTTADRFEITANVVDVLRQRVFAAQVRVADGRIAAVTEVDQNPHTFLLPGFIDAHVHIESSMLVPAEFARAAVVHGTVATVSDPHEIGNVLGTDGVRFMVDAAAPVPFKFYFGAPSCVPATSFETAGAAIDASQVAELLDDPRILYLSEMMNVPGVLNGDAEVTAKLEAARLRGKPVDGHAPGLRGEQVRAYVAAGISTDHECVTHAEARERLDAGAKLLIREGSAARNFDALVASIDDAPDRCMFCSDDKHPDELFRGHIDQLLRRAIHGGIDPMNALRTACINPILHYGLGVGMLRPGDAADFIEVDNLEAFGVLRTFIDGRLVAEQGRSLIPSHPVHAVNQFNAVPCWPEDFACQVPAGATEMHVIEAIDGQLITQPATAPVRQEGGSAIADPAHDLLKLAVVNRYQAATPAIAFARNFGLQRGAMASSVAHDCHNVIAVGASDEELCSAVNLVIEAGGGLSVFADGRGDILPLPVAGLMSTESCDKVGTAYAALDQAVKRLGSGLRAPYMTLSFMALLVISEIKLSDRGLFDASRFEFLPLFVGNDPSSKKVCSPRSHGEPSASCGRNQKGNR